MANTGNIATISGIILTDSGIDLSTKADLVAGLVPSSQLPSYVDDILEYAALANFPVTGEAGKIYVDLAVNKIYRWSGSAYIEVSAQVGTTWGGITGTLSNQTDLQNALNAKQATLSGTGFVKSTAGVISYDTNTYITGNQSISVTGDATGSGTTAIALTLANSGVTAGTYTKVTVDAKGRVTVGASLVSGDLPAYTGTITSGQVTTALGFTPYNATNPSGYITASALSSYLALSGGTLTGALSGTTASFSSTITAGGTITNQTSGGDAILYAKNGTVTTILVANTTGELVGIGGTESNHPYIIRTNNTERVRISTIGQLRLNTYTSATSYTGTAVASLAVDSAGNVITVAPGGGGASTDTLAIVTGRGATTTTSITAERYRGNNTLVLNTYTTVNPASNVFLYSQPNDRDSWIYLDSADTSSNWGIYHRQIDSAVSGLPANSLGFIGGGTSALQAWISLANGSASFAGAVTAGAVTAAALTVTGSLTYGSFTGASNYKTGADNILLKGNSTGVSGIFFESEKDGTNINHPSDFAFIQYHAHGIGGTTGEANRLVIGVSNDADDIIVLNPVVANGVVVRVGASTTESIVYHSGNLTNLNQLTNGPGYITGYSETSTLANVTARGATTNSSITVNGYITVRGANSSSSIYMSDDDEGQREMHCNSNRIGFLTQGGGWGSYCNDDGSWVSVSDITAFSDARVKENIVTVDNALEKVLQLRGVYYNRTDISDKSKKIGVIAQETQAVLPEVVHEEVDGMLGVAYGNMGGLFIEAFKEQQVQLMQQKAQIDELMEIVKTLKGL